jgi:protein-S-isoprenylcysteine O-methyltransferase Ste14
MRGGWAGRFRQTKVYDTLTAVPLAAWFALCFAAQLLGIARQPVDEAIDALTLLGRSSSLLFALLWVVLLLARRRPVARLGGLGPRLVALGGTYTGIGILLLPPRELPPALQLASTVLVLAGSTLAVAALLHLGRSAGAFPCRLCTFALQCACQWQRTLYEETVLQRAFPDYAAYRAATPALLPSRSCRGTRP